ncbi:putative oxoglutarate/iron-dependent dioxygenase, non-heme dioxygenase domain-containing protein [Rosa chinensis]|uniref:Putative oxoglutarate/iron-dependent dioxygenase, non-heme dioxygenase domain-containing protein n=1 Tax=Rosa chinensis TaxID=74649 RepID=A0A2P6SDX2_ROSCH|nr:putative oxoglutarate/iron-dependent dioxygenase, non-heme dioxygenase domain-containing protein [Rosa chinensis]
MFVTRKWVQTLITGFQPWNSQPVQLNWTRFNLCKRVREASENYGFFEIVYDKIPLGLRAEFFSATRQLFGLPLETQKKSINPKPYHCYYGQFPHAPLYESIGVEDASNYESLTSFAHIMWPDGHDQFCNIVIAMTLLRVQKYSAPPLGEYVTGLNAHTDKALTAILCDDQVSGLEFETKDGQWINLSLPSSSFVFIVGDPLMAWSNGRMHSVKHRVMMCGEKERYSLGAFGVPVEGTIIKAPKELVDEEHPQLFKDFDYMDFSMFACQRKQWPWTQQCKFRLLQESVAD